MYQVEYNNNIIESKVNDDDNGRWIANWISLKLHDVIEPVSFNKLNDRKIITINSESKYTSYNDYTDKPSLKLLKNVIQIYTNTGNNFESYNTFVMNAFGVLANNIGLLKNTMDVLGLKLVCDNQDGEKVFLYFTVNCDNEYNRMYETNLTCYHFVIN